MSMPDHNSAAEIQRDQEGADPTPFMKAALDEIVEQLMSGEKVRGLAWGLQDFLAEQDDLAEIVSAAISTCRMSVLSAYLDTEIERRLRAELEDHDAVHDLAAEMANEGEEE